MQWKLPAPTIVARALHAFRLGDVTFYLDHAYLRDPVLLILGGIIVPLIVGAWPAITAFDSRS